ncbi:MAG: fibronectin type III domain-containing protein [Candidatus Omnitrophota bacterium]
MISIRGKGFLGIFLAILLVGASWLMCADLHAADRAMWVWSMSENIVRDDPLGSQSDFFSFCDGPHDNPVNKIRTIYFSKTAGDHDVLALYPQEVRAFIKTAHSRGFKVMCLAGDRHWATPEKRAIGEAECDSILTFIKGTVNASERFDGINYDVEPYLLLTAWGDTYNWETPADYNKIWPEYIALMTNCAAKIKAFNTANGTSILFGADIPWWYDVDGYSGTSLQVQQLVDYVNLMDYRQTGALLVGAATTQLANAKAMNDAQKNNPAWIAKKVYIGVETSPARYPDPPSITYFEEGNAYLETQLAYVASNISSAEFGGVAIHYYEDVSAGEWGYRRLWTTPFQSIAFQPAQQVTKTTAVSEKNYHAASFRNEVYLIWVEQVSSYKYNLKMDKSRDNGRTWGEWSPAKDIVVQASGSGDIFNKILVDRRGNIFVGYAENGALKIIKSTDNGNHFSPITAPPSASWDGNDFAIDETGTIVYVVSSQSYGFLFARSTDGGATFSSWKSFTFPSFPMSGSPTSLQMQMTRDGKTVYLFGIVNEKSPAYGFWRLRLVYSKSTDSGTTFTPFADVHPAEFPYGTAHHAANIKTAMDRTGKVFVVWTVSDPTTEPLWPGNFLILSEFDETGTGFVHTQINDVGSKADLATLEVDDDLNIYTAFYRSTYDAQHAKNVYTLYYDERPRGGAFGADRLIYGPYLSPDTLERPCLAQEKERKHTMLLWKDIPTAADQKCDLYGEVFISSFPRLGIGDKRVLANTPLKFTVNATASSGNALTYGMYKGGDANHADGLTPLDILAMINALNSGITRYGLAEWDCEKDTDNNDYLTPVDILRVINDINSGRTQLPADISFDRATGVFSWTPTTSSVDPILVTFTTVDGTWKNSETINVTVYAGPIITTLAPASMSPAGSGEGEAGTPQNLTLQGANFGRSIDECFVTFKNKSTGARFSAQVTDCQQTSLTCIIPNLPIGVYDVIVTNFGGSSVAKTFTVALPTYTITATQGANGTISPLGATEVTRGASQVYTIVPAPGYVINDVTVDGSLHPPLRTTDFITGTYTFTNVTVPHTISATFILGTYTITATQSANGIISPAGSIGVPGRSNQLYTISPAPRYVIKDVAVDGVSVGAVTSYMFSNVTASHRITASFALPPAPAAPTIGTATSVTRYNARINWIDNANNEDGFKIYQWNPSTLSWYVAAYVGKNTNSVNHATSGMVYGLLPNMTYIFRVTAYTFDGRESAPSGNCTIQTPR